MKKTKRIRSKRMNVLGHKMAHVFAQSALILLQCPRQLIIYIQSQFKLVHNNKNYKNNQTYKYSFDTIKGFKIMGGAFLSQPITTKVTNKYQHNKIRVVTCQMQGWRKNMQDAMVFHRISKDIFLFAVFDGHGGMQVAKYSAKHIIEQLPNNQNFINKNYEAALEQTFHKLDKMMDTPEGQKQLKEITVQNGIQSFADGLVSDSVGCTANVVLMVQNTVYVANAGDSRSALSRNGKIIQLSKDHKPQDPQQQKRIVDSGAKVQKGRINGHLNLSRCLGDYHYKRNAQLTWDKQTLTSKPDIKKIELCKDDDFLIIGCDGIWQRYQTNGQQLVDHIRGERVKGKQPQQVLQQLMDKNLGKSPSQHLGCDNMSAMLVQFNKLTL